jgi:hypothetical protein
VRRHAAVVLGASLAVAACSADEFATPDGGGDGGVDAPVVVDSGADVRDSVAPPADAPADAPPKSWCLESSQLSADACADFDEGDVQSTFTKGGVPKTIVCGGGSGGTATLVSGGGGGRLKLTGLSTSVLAPEASCEFKFTGSAKNTWVADFDVPELLPASVTKPVTVATFLFESGDPFNCGFDLQLIPGSGPQYQFQVAHGSVFSTPSPLTTVSHLQLKVDYNPNTQEFAVTVKESGNAILALNYPPGCNTPPTRTTIFSPHYFSPPANGGTTILFDKITVTAN